MQVKCRWDFAQPQTARCEERDDNDRVILAAPGVCPGGKREPKRRIAALAAA
jgi:hypothetical protein